MEAALEIKKSRENSVYDLVHNQEDGSKPSFLHRPTISFIFEKHDLDKLRYLLRKNLRKAICSVYGLQVYSKLLNLISLFYYYDLEIQTLNF